MAETVAAKAERVSERSRVSGIERAVQICDHLLAAGRPLTAYDVSKALGAPMSTIYGVVDSLLRQDLLSRDGDGLLWFGPRLYHYGLAYGRSLNLLETASQEMRELSRLLGETVQVCGRDDGHMVVLAMAEPAGHFRVSSKIGTRVPLNWTASGRLLIGHLPWAERVELMRRAAQPSPTGMAETDPDTLCRIAEAALTEKLAIQLSEIRLRRRLHRRADLHAEWRVRCHDQRRAAGAEGARARADLQRRGAGSGEPDRAPARLDRLKHRG